MTDHDWAQGLIAAAAVGGLPADEAARLDAHVRDCAECAAALAATSNLDRGLESLFAPMHPGPNVELRAIRELRREWTRQTVTSGWGRKLAIGVAASVGLGLTGAGMSLLAGSELPLPGGGRMGAQLQNGRTVAALGEFRPRASTFWFEAADPDKAGEAAPASPTTREAPAVSWEVTQWADKLGTRLREGKPTDLYAEVSPGKSDGTVVLHDGVGKDVSAVLESATSLESELKLRQLSASRGLQPPIAGYAVTNGSAPAVDFSKHTTMGYATNYGLQVLPPADPKLYFKPSEHSYKLSLPTPTADDTARYSPQVAAVISPPKSDPSTTTAGALPLPALIQEPKPAPVVGQPPKAPEPAPVIARKVIRSGEIEFEIDSFDSAVAGITKLVAAINGGFIATVNSEKLPNGKVKGSVVVRVPPDSLDGLVLDLRRDLGKVGELKGQKIGSQDITKQYFDLESRLKAARAMEQRLLEMIKTGKGEIKQLLDAEKELGVWRTKIEEYEGELRYYSNQVSLSTLTITLAEKEIRAAAGLTECERVQAGVEVEEVEQAFRQIQTAVAEAKGRITKSELKQLSAGQFNATLNFEVAPEAAGPIRDRLKQLGRVARLEIDKVQTADGTVGKDAKIKRGDTMFMVQLYNLANVAPRETAVVTAAVLDVPTAYQALRDAVAKSNGRVFTAQLNEQDRQNVTATLDFEIKRTEEAAIRAALDAAGDVIARQVNRAAESDTVTDTKVRVQASLVSAARLRPRETTVLAVEVADVDASVAVIGARVNELKGRQVDSQIARERNGRVTAKLIYDVPLATAASVVEAVKGTVRVSQTSRDPQAPEGKYATARLEVTLSNAEQIVAPDDGIWPQVRKGLSYSVTVLLTSLTWVVFGLCVVLPWAVVGYGGYRLLRRMFRTRAESPGT